MKWIHTERATVERARELLAHGSSQPIYIRWRRAGYYDGGWNSSDYQTCTLEGTTDRRLKLRSYTGAICTADPNRCYFATKENR